MSEPSSIKEVNESKDFLLDWSGKKQLQLTLTYRGSRDGFTNQQFHSKVDGKGPSNLVFIQSEMGLVFGAYTSKAFYTPQHSDEESADENAYIFSISKKTKHIQYQNKEKAIRNFNSSRLFSFGSSPDIGIYNQSNSNKQSYSNFGYTYKLCDGLKVGSDEANSYLAGEHKFKVTEVEVYDVKFIE